MTLPCSVKDLIPQKGKMGFEQNLLKAKLDGSLSIVDIPRDHIFLNDRNQLSNLVLIEYINQLIAAVHGYHGKYQGKAVQKGLFVGLQDVEFMQPVYLGDRLTLKGSVIEEVSQVTFVQGKIYRDGQIIADLVTKLYEVKDSTEFDLLTNQQTLTQKGPIQPSSKQVPAYLDSNIHRKLYGYLHDVTINNDLIAFQIACTSDFEAFDGHFPERPILPGILLLEIVNLALNLLFKQTMQIRSLKRMKISGVILPDQIVACTLKIDRSDNSFSAVFKEGEERELSRFNGCFEEGKNNGQS